MELIVDANVLLSCFMRDGTTRALFLDSRFTLFAPEYLLSETNRHLGISASFRKRSGLSHDELQSLFEILTQRIKTISAETYSSFMKEAISLASHREDAPYLALALFLRISIWSNDGGLQKQQKVKIYTTTELVRGL